MAVGTTHISVEEYLRTNYEPNCEYIDGVLRQKPWPTWHHGMLEGRVALLINVGYPDFVAGIEATVRIRPTRYLVPDVAVQRANRQQQPYPTEPVHLCIEIKSPDDRIGDLFNKCSEYHEWGVETTWIVDPESKRAWTYRKGQLPTEVPALGALTAEGISISLSDLFSVL
jgi:Uma2 family endonuclease